ncbi:MAG: YajQ family cyclic di-GMP-binding protein [Myxococcota bacterium]
MPSFDIVSEIDRHELDNAINQAKKEIAQRFDFKGTGTDLELTPDSVVIRSETEGRLDAAWDVLTSRLVRRGLPLEAFKRGEPQPAGGKTMRQDVAIQVGIPTETGREIVKMVKGMKLKVQVSIQGDTVRVTGKKRDDLQEVIKAVKEADLGIAMQFKNYRD